MTEMWFTHGNDSVPDLELLERIRDERGYTLSYHEIFCRTEPEILRRYSELYRSLTLTPRRLSPSSREIVWCAILVLAREEVGTIHLERAQEAGVPPEKVAAAISLASTALVDSTLRFADAHWAAWLPTGWAEHAARTLEDAAADSLSDDEAALVRVVSHASVQNERAFVGALARCYELHLDEGVVAEALSYMLLPRGANALLWATDAWLQAARGRELSRFNALSDVTAETRRA